MSDSVLQRLATRRTAGTAAGITSADRPAPVWPPAEPPPEAEDLGAFGFLRGIRDRAVMLQLCKRNGNILAVGYGYIERAEFDPTEGITLLASGRKIQIKGRNLNAEARPGIRLFEGLTRHKVSWVREIDLHKQTRDDTGDGRYVSVEAIDA